MKLRNKKTGEILGLGSFIVQNPNHINCENITKYDSLAELNEEWEDCEDYEEYYWFICTESGYFGIRKAINVDDSDFALFNKEIGNYFETKEEAEKAVEKLKAWKLLKDECNIKFVGLIRDKKAMLKGVKLDYDRHQVTFDRMQECVYALQLLFGGEE